MPKVSNLHTLQVWKIWELKELLIRNGNQRAPSHLLATAAAQLAIIKLTIFMIFSCPKMHKRWEIGVSLIPNSITSLIKRKKLYKLRFSNTVVLLVYSSWIYNIENDCRKKLTWWLLWCNCCWEFYDHIFFPSLFFLRAPRQK